MTPAQRMTAAQEVSPLSVLVRGVLEWAFPPGSWQTLLTQTAPAQVTRKLTISAITWLMIQVVSGARRSVHAAYQADQALPQPTLDASFQALYTKLGRLNPTFSAAAVRASAERLNPVLHAAGRTEFPGWTGYQVRFLDGTDLDGTEHRLKVLRTIAAAGLPGRLVVEFDPASGLSTDAVISEDAYTSERILVMPLVERAQPKDLCVADAHFCTTNVLFGLHDRRAYFVVREHAQLRCRAQGKLRYVGRVATGAVWEQDLIVEETTRGTRRRFRRIVLKLDQATEEGETEITLVSNLPRSVSGLRIAELYRERWTIEGHFSFLKNCLKGEIESLGQPRAALFAMCMALVAGNALALVRQAIGAAHGEEELEKLSGYYLADELGGNLRAIEALLSQACWKLLLKQPAEQFWSWCVTVASAIRTRAFYRHPRGPKKPKVKRQSGKTRPHYSTYRLLHGKE